MKVHVASAVAWEASKMASFAHNFCGHVKETCFSSVFGNYIPGTDFLFLFFICRN